MASSDDALRSNDFTVLVVDDDEDTTMLLCEVLASRGYRAVPMLSGAQGLEFLGDGVADVIVTDLQMPGMSGLDLCRELQIRHPQVPRIVLTGVVDLRNENEDELQSTAFAVIRKPVKTDLLVAAIEHALEHVAKRPRTVLYRPESKPAEPTSSHDSTHGSETLTGRSR